MVKVETVPVTWTNGKTTKWQSIGTYYDGNMNKIGRILGDPANTKDKALDSLYAECERVDRVAIKVIAHIAHKRDEEGRK